MAIGWGVCIYFGAGRKGRGWTDWDKRFRRHMREGMKVCFVKCFLKRRIAVRLDLEGRVYKERARDVWYPFPTRVSRRKYVNKKNEHV